MIVKSKLNGQLRRPKNTAQRKALAHRDWLRRQQEYTPVITPEPEGEAPQNVQQASFQPQPPTQGEEVEANEGEWNSSTPITYEYQWQLDGVDIVGATAKTLLVLIGMVGGALRCVVKATNSTGFTLSITASIEVVGVTPEPAINYVARLDGVSQYWQLSDDIAIPPSGTIELEVMYSSESTASNDYILTSEGSSSTSMFLSFNSQLSVGSSGIISSFTVDGMETNNFPYDDEFHEIACNVPSINGRVGILGARFNFVRTIDAAIRKFIIKDSLGVIVNEIPLTNKDQGATQLATIGSVNAFMPNYSSDVWEVAP